MRIFTTLKKLSKRDSKVKFIRKCTCPHPQTLKQMKYHATYRCQTCTGKISLEESEQRRLN